MRRRLSLCLSLLLTAAPAFSADDPLNPKSFTPITKLKTLYPQTVLARDGQPKAVIIAPDKPGCEPAIQRLNAALRSALGFELKVIPSAELVDNAWRVNLELLNGQTPVVVGNVNTNRLAAWLWSEGYTVEDSIYPGDGGHVVRTVHDPFANGLNALVLAGSSPQGVDKAVQVFVEKHAASKGRDLVLPEPLVDIVLERKAYPFFPDPGQEFALKRMPQFRSSEGVRQLLARSGFADDKGQIVSHADPKTVVTQLTRALELPAASFHRTGDKGLLPIMKELLDKNRHLLKNPDKLHDMGHRASGFAPLWDLAEEWPVWTDQDRLDITNALLRDAMLGH